MKVRHVPLEALTSPEFFVEAAISALIALSAPDNAHTWAASPSQAGFHVCWLHQLPHDPAMQPLFRHALAY